MSQSILYYPTINIEDCAWLRNAILYWDEVCSIVPDAYDVNYSPEIEWLKGEEIYRPININEKHSFFDDLELTKEINQFINFMDNADGLISQNILKEDFKEYIHQNKISNNFKNSLVKKKHIRINDSEWYECSQKMAIKYMSILAKFVAKHDEQDMIIGTDKNKYLKLPYERSYNNYNDFSFSLFFEHAIPSPSMNVSFEEILDFKIKRGQEFLSLRSKIRELEITLSSLENIEECKHTINVFKESWQYDLECIDKLMKDYKIKYFLGTAKTLFRTSVPEIINSIQTVYGTTPTWMVATGVATYGLIGLGQEKINYRSQINKMRDNSAFTYLYDGLSNGIIQRKDFCEYI